MLAHTAIRLPTHCPLASLCPAPAPPLPSLCSPQIYGMGGSTCTQRVLITAFENEAPFEIKVGTHTNTHTQAQ